MATVFCLLHDCVEPEGFSSEAEGLHALEFVNSFDFWYCKKKENSRNFSYVHLSNCSLIVNSNSNRFYSHRREKKNACFQ